MFFNFFSTTHSTRPAPRAPATYELLDDPFDDSTDYEFVNDCVCDCTCADCEAGDCDSCSEGCDCSDGYDCS